MNEKTGKDARWPFVVLYCFMWAGMIGTGLNEDPIRFDLKFTVVFGLIAIMGIVIFIAAARFHSRSPYAFNHSTVIGNLAWHIFLLTGIVFISFLFFASTVQILVLKFDAPLFESGCDKISQRDVSLFVWGAMAKGAVEFAAKYLPLPAAACAPDQSSRITGITTLAIRSFAALVLVWYAIGLGKAWYFRLRKPRGAGT
ncbi:MAG: hypothetical protein ACLPPF_07095 [Rhodomicrobium sp.]